MVKTPLCSQVKANDHNYNELLLDKTFSKYLAYGINKRKSQTTWQQGIFWGRYLTHKPCKFCLKEYLVDPFHSISEWMKSQNCYKNLG